MNVCQNAIILESVLCIFCTIAIISLILALNYLDDAIFRKLPVLANRKSIILQQDTARPHSTKIIQQKVRELGWEVLAHPIYSPDIAPSNYYLFRSLQYFLVGKKFADYDHVKLALVEFFDSKGVRFYKEGIKKLVSKQ